MTAWLDVILQGLLNGGIFTLFALGLAVAYGVMRIVNLAQGDFVILSAYFALTLTNNFHIDPFLAIVPVGLVMYGIGYALQGTLINRVIGSNPLPPLLITFGLSIIIQNALLLSYTADAQSIHAAGLNTANLQLDNSLSIGWLPLITLATAVAVTGFVDLIFRRTSLGMALRATSDNPVIAGMMGIRAKHMYAMAMGLALALDAVGGVFAGMRSTFSPYAGPNLLLYAFEAVVVGGPGSIWGTLVGAIAIGLAQAIGAQIDPGLGVLGGHLLFFAVLLIRPHGLFPKTR